MIARLFALIAFVAIAVSAQSDEPVAIANSTSFKKQAGEVQSSWKKVRGKQDNKDFFTEEVTAAYTAAIDYDFYTTAEPAAVVEAIDNFGFELVKNVTLFSTVLDDVEKWKAIAEFVIANAAEPDNTLEVPDYYTEEPTSTNTTDATPVAEPTSDATPEPTTTAPAASAATSNMAGIFVALAALSVMLL